MHASATTTSSAAVWRQARRPRWLFALALLAGLTVVCLITGGGFSVGQMTVLEVVLQVGAGVAAIVAILAGGGRRPWGLVPIALFGLLALITIASIGWSIAPSESWLESNRTLAWLGAFVIGVVAARLAGEWLNQLLYALLGVAVIVSAVALVTKVAPASFDPDESYARLRAPYDYWNSVGLTAALGLPGCMWLVARNQRHDPVSALAYPATALLATALLLSYSRGALLALGTGLIFWFALVPHRLRGVAVLAVGATGAVLVSLYAFGRQALTIDRVRIDLRSDAGHDFGVALAAMLVLVLAAGLAIEFARARRKPSELAYRRAGIVTLVLVALIPLGLIVRLTASDRGLTGSISHAWSSVTDPNARVGNDVGRLTATGSVRARYWNEALQIFAHHPWAGVGAGGYQEARTRYRKDAVPVRHAHGYVVQTASDLGIVGLLASLALLLAIVGAAGRVLGFRLGIGGRSWRGPPPPARERLGLIALATIVVIFGVHSLVDWTWFIPGNALVALLAAGWLCGRGTDALQPASMPLLWRRMRDNVREPVRAALATAVAVLTICALWATWQPWRSARQSDAAIAALNRAATDPSQLRVAREHASNARDINPLAVDPLFELGAIDAAAARPDAAAGWFQDAIRLQPANADTWRRYADFLLTDRDQPLQALQVMRVVMFLDPHSLESIRLLQQIAARTGTQYVPPPQPNTTNPSPGS